MTAEQYAIVNSMVLLVGLVLVLIMFEIVCIFLPPLEQKILVPIIMGVLAVDSVFVVGLRPTLWTALLAYFSIFRLINLIKLVDGRKQAAYLRDSCLRSSISLGIYQVIVLVLVDALDHLSLSAQAKWQLLASLALVGLLVIAMSFQRALVKTRPKLKPTRLNERQLPSLTVAIPARNETSDLEQCLKSLITSDYPKLEILVLDDCSQEKRTPEIIRQYAHLGVRFLSGKVPGESWTAKNFAYEQLSEEANGEIILFCGVDVRFSSTTIHRMVELKQRKAKSMISFMPLNEIKIRNLKTLLVQPVRYLWELGLPRRSFNRPPVLSSCWLINRSALLKNGSFKAVSRSIVPERYFARQTAKSHDGYSFVALGKDLGLSSVKTFEEQLETAIRTKYPLLKQRLEHVAIVCLVQLVLFVSPIGLLIYGIVQVSWWLIILSGLCLLLASLIFSRVFKLTYGRWLLLKLLAMPIAMAWDIGLNLYSMWEYEFNKIDWKGRNVCVPVMQLVANPLGLSKVGDSNKEG